MASDSSMSITQTIPGTVTISASGNAHVHAFVLQADCDCSVQFFKADGTTELSGKFHIPSYEVFSEALQGNGLLLSDSGVKLTVSGNVSGTLRGFVTVNK